MTPNVRRVRLRNVLAAACVAGAPAAAAAQPVALAWSTYLRTGPAQTYAVIAELEHDTPVTVGPCAGGWCRVSTAHAAGFVDQQAVNLPRTPLPQPAVETDCVTALQASNRKPIATRFCSPPPTAAPAPAQTPR